MNEEKIRPKPSRYYIMNNNRLIYMTSGRANMMVEYKRGGTNYDIYHTNDEFKECGRDTPYKFFQKYLVKDECTKRPQHFN